MSIHQIAEHVKTVPRKYPLTFALIIVLILAIAFSGLRVWASLEASRAGGRHITNQEAISTFHFDPTKGEKGVISYDLTAPAKVRVRIVNREDPELIYKTLISYQEQVPGTHKLEWDGRDDAGNFVDLNTVGVQIQAELLSTKLTQKAVEMFSLVGSPYGHLHRLHDPNKCGFFTIHFTEPASESVLSGEVKLLIEVVGPFRGYAEEGGVGIRGYVDKTLVLDQWLEPEDVRAKFPYLTWTLDTSAFPDGEHILRLSMCDHKDHPGVASLKVKFDN